MKERRRRGKLGLGVLQPGDGVRMLSLTGPLFPWCCRLATLDYIVADILYGLLLEPDGFRIMRARSANEVASKGMTKDSGLVVSFAFSFTLSALPASRSLLVALSEGGRMHELAVREARYSRVDAPYLYLSPLASLAAFRPWNDNHIVASLGL